MVKQYETTFIVDAHLSGEQIENTISKITQFIEKNGGKIKLIDRWGKRRLVYEIAKKQYGYYVYVRFEAEGSIIKALEREYKLNDTIIRFLSILLSKVALQEEAKSQAESKTKASNEEESEIISNDSEPPPEEIVPDILDKSDKI